MLKIHFLSPKVDWEKKGKKCMCTYDNIEMDLCIDIKLFILMW